MTMVDDDEPSRKRRCPGLLTSSSLLHRNDVAADLAARALSAMSAKPQYDDEVVTELYNYFRDALSAEISRTIVGRDDGSVGNDHAALDTALQRHERLLAALLQRTKRSAEDHQQRINASIDSNATIKRALGKVREYCTQSRIFVSPILTFCSDAEDSLVSACSAGWLMNDALCRDGYQSASVATATTGATATTAVSRHNAAINDMLNTIPSLGALTTETLVRQVRLQNLQILLHITGNKEGVSKATVQTDFPSVRTKLYCEYDLLTCASLHNLNMMRRRFRANFMRGLERRLEQAFRMEREENRLRDEARERLADMHSAIETEHDTIRKIIRRVTELSDEDAALTVRLANAEAELLNRSGVVLHKAYKEIHVKMNDHLQVRKLRDSVDELTRTRDDLTTVLIKKSKPACRLLRQLLSDDDVRWPTTTAVDDVTKHATCRRLAFQNYDRIIQAASHCESSGALTTCNIDEIDIIIRQCKPLQRLRSQYLSDARRDLRAEEERHERLEQQNRHRQQQRATLHDYSIRMYRYIKWLQCFDEITSPG